MLVFLLSAITVYGQENPVPERGFNPVGSYALSDLESFNTTNGDMMLRIPLASLPANRGGKLSTQISLIYNSKIWDPYGMIMPNPYNNSVVTGNVITRSKDGGWRYGMQYQLNVRSRVQDYYTSGYTPQCPSWEAMYIYRVTMSFPDGSEHEFRPYYFSDDLNDGYFNVNPDGQKLTCGCTSQGCQLTTSRIAEGVMTYFSTDGSHLRLDIAHDTQRMTQWTLYFPDGGRVVAGNVPQRIYDSNNNYIEFQNITYNTHPATKIADQLGRYLIVEYDSATRQDYIYQWGVNNVQIKTTVKWKSITVNKTINPECSGSGCPTALTYTLSMIERITLPTQAGGLSYSFDYNANTVNPSYGWGELSSITLPSGARAEYDYRLDGLNNQTAREILRDSPTRKDLIYRQEYDLTATPANTPCDPLTETCTTETWLYSFTTTTGQITSPDGGVSRDYFDDPEVNRWSGNLVYKSERPDKTIVERIWNENKPYSVTAMGNRIVNPFAKTEFTTIKDAAGVSVKTAIKDFNYDKNGNVTRIAEYDWVDYGTVPRDANGKPTGIPAGAPLKRVTINTYNSPTPDAADSTTNDPDTYVQASSKQLRNAIATSEVSSNGTLTLARTEFTYDNATTTGNLTQQKSWDSYKGGVAQTLTRPLSATNSISVSHQYDVYGNRTLTTDANGVQTQFVYGLVGGFSNLYPTQINAAYTKTVQRTTNLAYDFYAGLVTLSTDADNNVSTATSYDALGRPTLVQAADGRAEETQTFTTYSDAGRYVIIRSDKDLAGDRKLVSIRHFDQLGRIRLTRQLEDATTQSATDETTGIKVQTRYRIASPNNYQLVSNPYRATTSGGAGTEPTMGWTLTKRDNGGRVIAVQSFSGAGMPAPWGTNTSTTGTVATAYDSIYTTVTDQAGKKRRNMLDGLGRLDRVDEPDGANNLGTIAAPTLPTDYTYDALSNLTQVGQGVQTRTFSYSSLSRLISAINPESGTISYLYDNNGNLTRKTDARSIPIQANYAYDALNRITSANYSDTTPDIAYYYDAQTLPTGAPIFARGSSEGRLVAVTYGGTNAGSYYGYNGLGQVLTRVQRTDLINYVVDATYNKAGAITTETYPSVPGGTSRRKVAYSFDSAGRLLELESLATNYAAGANVDSISYASHGGLSSEKLGNTLIHTLSYNNRLQPTKIKLGTSTLSTSVLNLTYNYGTTANNGNVQDVTNQIGTSTTKQIYSYDSLNRLSSTQETNGSTTTYWTQTNGYDRYGNRWAIIGGSPNLTFNAQNKITSAGYSYDAVGNLTDDPLHTYTYDAENRVITVDTASAYKYDGEGKRVRKLLGENLRFVYDMSSRLVAEFNGLSGDLEKEYIYGADGLAATIEPTVGTTLGTKYTTSDHLGSPRIVTDADGDVVSRHDYMPFGEELFVGSGGRTAAQFYDVADGLRQKFTGYARDDESRLDYAQARYYASAQGRFTSTDSYNPISDAGKDIFRRYLGQPQNWNHYVYCINNPLTHVDPTGLAWYVLKGVYGAKPEWHDEQSPFDPDKYELVVSYVYKSVTSGKYFALNPFANEYAEVDTADEANARYQGFIINQALGDAPRLPDKVSVNLSLVFFGTSWTLDRYGNLYGSGDFLLVPTTASYTGAPSRIRARNAIGASLTADWMGQFEKPSEEEIRTFVEGSSFTITGGSKVVGGVQISGNRKAFMFGVGTPGVNASFSLSERCRKLPIQW
jgi:RHS repeat-associated protein